MSDNQNGNTGWTGGQNAFGDFAPGMVHYTDKVLFDEVWERQELSHRDPSLVPDPALTAPGKMYQLQFHVALITPGKDVSNEWLEPVTDEAYGKLPKSGDHVTDEEYSS